jgi:uncharacterized membrane protein YfcA
MNTKDIIVSVVLGLLCGFMSGFTGITPIGIILIGLLASHFVSDYKTLIGTLLYVIIFPISIGSVWLFYKNKKINFLLGNILVVTMIIGSFIGSKLILESGIKISDRFIKHVTGVIGILVGLYFITR